MDVLHGENDMANISEPSKIAFVKSRGWRQGAHNTNYWLKEVDGDSKWLTLDQAYRAESEPEPTVREREVFLKARGWSHGRDGWSDGGRVYSAISFEEAYLIEKGQIG